VDAPIEECDDGDTIPGDGCDIGCKIEAGWECFSGNNLALTAHCLPLTCPTSLTVFAVIREYYCHTLINEAHRVRLVDVNNWSCKIHTVSSLRIFVMQLSSLWPQVTMDLNVAKSAAMELKLEMRSVTI